MLLMLSLVLSSPWFVATNWEVPEITLIVYEVNPHVGVGPVKLGMTRDEVHRLMPGPNIPFRKSPDDKHETDAFHDAGFQVFYTGDAPVVEYIELSAGLGLQAIYDGISVFEKDASEVVAHISRNAAFDPDDWELGYSYVFRALDLSLWRPFLPESPNDPEGRQFMTIGIGVKGYYAKPG